MTEIDLHKEGIDQPIKPPGPCHWATTPRDLVRYEFGISSSFRSSISHQRLLQIGIGRSYVQVCKAQDETSSHEKEKGTPVAQRHVYHLASSGSRNKLSFLRSLEIGLNGSQWLGMS